MHAAGTSLQLHFLDQCVVAFGVCEFRLIYSMTFTPVTVHNTLTSIFFARFILVNDCWQFPIDNSTSVTSGREMMNNWQSSQVLKAQMRFLTCIVISQRSFFALMPSTERISA